MHIIVIALISVVLWAAPVAAQDSRVLLGINFGVTNPVGDFGDELDRDTSIAGHVAIRLTGSLAIRGEIGRNQFAFAEDLQAACGLLGFSCSAEARLTNYNVGVQYGGFGDQNRGAMGLAKVRVAPYGFVTIGRYTAEASGNFGGGPIDAGSETFLGYNVGAGLNIRITDNFGLAGDIRAHGVRADEDETDLRKWQYFLVPSVGVWVLF